MITAGMAAHLNRSYRNLAWMAWFERDGADLYMWSGSYHATHDGHLWYGYGYLTSIDSVQKREGTQHVDMAFEMNGLDPTILADLDDSVRGRAGKLWLAGVGQDRQIVRDPILIAQMKQDTLAWSYGQDGTVTLRLNCYDALPFVGRATKGKWSDQDQQARYAGDTGFDENTTIALQGAAVPWRLT